MGPRLLTGDMKENRARCSLTMYHMYEENEKLFLFRLTTGDETWVFPYTQNPKRHKWNRGSRRGKTTGQGEGHEIEIRPWWQFSGTQRVHCWLTYCRLELQWMVNTTLIWLISWRLRWSSYGGENERGVELLLHDNAPVHASAVSKEAIRKAGFTELPHPAYSPDLAPSDYYLFPNL